jgi:phage terminase large subunit
MSELEVEAKFPKIFKPLDQPYRYKMIWGGRGKGASWTVARKLLIRGTEKPLRILCTRELQKSIKQSVHKLLSDQIDKLQLNNFYDVQSQGIFGVNGTEIFFIGVKANPDEIKSMEGIDICWIEEGHALTESSWDIIDPTIRKDGSEIWATWNTRFKFDYLHNVFVINKLYQDALVLKVNYPDNPYFPEVLRKQMEAMKASDYEKYLNIWEGELKTLAEGAIFGSQVLKAKKEDRFCKIPVATGSQVYTFWDLGRNDHTAIWFMQNIGKEYRMIDYYENRLQDIEHYCKVVAGQLNPDEMRLAGVSEADQLRRSNYLYGEHFMPHDVKAQSLGMKLTREEQFIQGGVKPINVVKRIALKNDAIEMARQIFGEVWFDSTNCSRGIECLSNYRYEYNDNKDTHNQNPHHDWASNGADAFMQFAQGFRVKEEYKPLPQRKLRHRA